MWRRRKRRVDKTKQRAQQQHEISGISIVSTSGYPTKSPVRKRSEKGKLGVVSTPVHARRHSSRGTMSRYAGASALISGGGGPGHGARRGPNNRKYNAKYLYGSDHVTSSEEMASADKGNMVRSRSQDRKSRGQYLNRVKSGVERGRTKSRERQQQEGGRENVKRHESKDRYTNKPTRGLSIDPKLRTQIIEEAVKKARERQLSRNREVSKSGKTHSGSKVERKESAQVRRKSSERSSGHHLHYPPGEERSKDHKSPPPPTGKSHGNTPVVPRDRTPDDIEEWLKWRCYLNHQLSVYIFKGGSGRGNSASSPVPPPPVVDIMSVPEKLDKDTKSAIWSHAQREQPKTSLDSNAYIVYGIPRARVRPNGPNYRISHYAVPCKTKLGQSTDANTTENNTHHIDYSSDQAVKTYMSPRENAQQHGVAERRPQSPKLQPTPHGPGGARPLSPVQVSKSPPPPVSPKPLVPPSHGDAGHNHRPLSPRTRSQQHPKDCDDMRERGPSGGFEPISNRLSRPVSPSGSNAMGPANLREMYKKPFLRPSQSAPEPISNCSTLRPSDPRRQASVPAALSCAENGTSAHIAPKGPYQRPSHRPLSTSFLHRQESQRYDSSQADEFEFRNMSGADFGGVVDERTPNMRFSPETIRIKRPTSPGLVTNRTNDESGNHSHPNHNYVINEHTHAPVHNYVNVHRGVGGVCRTDCCGPLPPTPPPLPPKSFHCKK